MCIASATVKWSQPAEAEMKMRGKLRVAPYTISTKERNQLSLFCVYIFHMDLNYQQPADANKNQK